MRSATQRRVDVLKRVLIGAAVGTISLVSFSTMAGASNASKATAWAKQNHATPILQKIAGDVSAISKDANHTQKLVAACNALTRDVPQAQHLPAIPVASFESLWSRGLADLSKGAHSCLAAFTATDENQLGRAKSLGNKSDQQLNAGLALIGQLGSDG
jgi:hypothetical protein